jgi:hypothetical protein
VASGLDASSGAIFLQIALNVSKCNGNYREIGWTRARAFFRFGGMMRKLEQISRRCAKLFLPGLFATAALSQLQGQTNQHAFLYWEFHERGFQQAIRVGEWKAVRPESEKPIELYYLKTDLAEKQNVAAAHPEIVAKIEGYLKAARTDSAQWPIKKAEEQKAGAKPQSQDDGRAS